MPKQMIIMLALIVVGIVMPIHAAACTAFGMQCDADMLMGKNFDWYLGDGILVTNPRHAVKTAMIAMESDQPGAKWVSRYGSITFNQIAQDRPLGGMNEAGLAVTGLLLRETQYPGNDERPAIAQAQWIQYQLDNYATVAEVLASDSHLRIHDPKGVFGIHYMACDATGQCAAIDFIDGRMVSHTERALPARVQTNRTYEDSLAYLNGFQGFGGSRPMPDDIDSMDRFVRTAILLKSYDRKGRNNPVAYAFSVLQSAFQGRATRWSIVYNLTRRRVYFKTRENPMVRYADLGSFDFACDQPVKAYDLMANHAGAIDTHFQAFTPEQRRRQVMEVNHLYRFSPANVDVIVEYPNHIRCQGP